MKLEEDDAVFELANDVKTKRFGSPNPRRMLENSGRLIEKQVGAECVIVVRRFRVWRMRACFECHCDYNKTISLLEIKTESRMKMAQKCDWAIR